MRNSWGIIIMKISWFFILVLFCFPSSISSAAERNVIGNTFHSEDPKLNIVVGPEFKYLGKTDNLKQKRRVDTYEDYLFLPKESNKGSKLSRYLFIQIRSREKDFKDTTPENLKNLDFGTTKLDSKNFNYFKRIRETSSTFLTVKFLQSRGYIVPTCIITNTFYSFPYKNTVVSIVYNEDATLLNMSCETPYSRETLSGSQRSDLSDFHKRAFASIGIGPATIDQKATVAKSPPARKSEDDSLKHKEPVNQTDNRINLSVFAFKPINIDVVQYSPEVTTQLINALKENPSFSILDRRDLEEFLRVNELQQNDNMDNILNIGKRLGLNFIVSGSIEQDGVLIVLTCSVVDIHKAEIAYRSKIKTLGHANLVSNVKKLSDAITTAISSRSR
jgi:TolB-like protein